MQEVSAPAIKEKKLLWDGFKGGRVPVVIERNELICFILTCPLLIISVLPMCNLAITDASFEQGCDVGDCTN